MSRHWGAFPKGRGKGAEEVEDAGGGGMYSLFGRPGERGRVVGGGEGDEEVGADEGGAGVEAVCNACKACNAC
jgi:hypothetical protein